MSSSLWSLPSESSALDLRDCSRATASASTSLAGMGRDGSAVRTGMRPSLSPRGGSRWIPVMAIPSALSSNRRFDGENVVVVDPGKPVVQLLSQEAEEDGVSPTARCLG